jgi:quercetin dioxygenase-like cupin family protein
MALTDKQLSDAGVGVSHHFGGGAYVKETYIPAGASLTQHSHEHDHLAYLVSGRVTVDVDGIARTYTGPHGFLIPAGKEHGVLALSPAIWLCIWSSDCTDPATIDQALEAGK